MHIHNSLSNVAIHTHYINIHHTGHYQSEMGFVHPLTHCTDLTAFSCFLQQNQEAYLANSHLISDTCTVISTSQVFVLKYFHGAPLKIYLHEY